MFFGFQTGVSVTQLLFAFGGMILLGAIIWHFAFRPDGAAFEQSVVVDAPRERVFSAVNTLKCWCEWIPRLAELKQSRGPFALTPRQPAIRFEGPASGKGAVMVFDDQENGTVTRFEILEHTDSSAVVVSQQLVSSTSPDGERSVGSDYPTIHRITIEARINSTKVTWVSSTNSHSLQAFVQRAMAAQYRSELAAWLIALKTYVESRAA
jgi:hypothetical protein